MALSVPRAAVEAEKAAQAFRGSSVSLRPTRSPHSPGSIAQRRGFGVVVDATQPRAMGTQAPLARSMSRRCRWAKCYLDVVTYALLLCIVLLLGFAIHMELASVTEVKVHEPPPVEKSDTDATLQRLREQLASSSLPRPPLEGRVPPLGQPCAAKLLKMLSSVGTSAHCEYSPGPVNGQCCCRLKPAKSLVCLPTSIVIGKGQTGDYATIAPLTFCMHCTIFGPAPRLGGHPKPPWRTRAL